MQNRLIVLVVVFFVFKISSCFAETVKEPVMACLGCPGCPGCPEPINCQKALCSNREQICLHGTYTPRDNRGCPQCPRCILIPKPPSEPVAHCLGCPGCPGCPPDNLQ